MLDRTSVPIHTPGYNRALTVNEDFDCTNEVFKCYYEIARQFYKSAVNMVVNKKQYPEGIVILLSPYHQFAKAVRIFLKGMKDIYTESKELEDIKLLENVLLEIDKVYLDMLAKIKEH